jgi:hypothetical protein
MGRIYDFLTGGWGPFTVGWAESWHSGVTGSKHMTDLIFIAVTFVFFALSALYARFCATL